MRPPNTVNNDTEQQQRLDSNVMYVPSLFATVNSSA